MPNLRRSWQADSVAVAGETARRHVRTVNFVGHARVASWTASDPGFVLGAMLPDFASMSRARLVGADHPRVSAGIALHHRTDEVFHGAPTFVALNEGGAANLEARGLGRGPARAVAHVGTELLLDGLLLDDAATRDAYLGAVRVEAAPLGLRFAHDGGARFTALHRRLAEHGLPEDYRSAEGVLLRLEQVLARRPRLAWAADARPLVLTWLRATRGALEEALPRLLDEVRHGLEEGLRERVDAPASRG